MGFFLSGVDYAFMIRVWEGENIQPPVDLPAAGGGLFSIPIGVENYIASIMSWRPLIWQIVQDMLHISTIDFKGFPALRSQAQHCVWAAAFERFFNLDIPCFFQFGHVSGEIAPGQPGLAHQEGEVRTLDHVQQGHQHQSAGLMDQAVDFVQCSQVGGRCFSHSGVPGEAADVGQ